jgi:hypothetical protein
MLKKRFAIVLLSTFALMVARAQVPSVEDLVKVPASPEAQAFYKYGNTPINLYSGAPDISIPIAKLQAREIEIPVTLTYDASGVKVEQIATWAGLGWNLNVGGMVTRQTIGRPDDYNPSLTHPDYFPFYTNQVKSDFEFVRDFSVGGNQSFPQGQLKRYFDFVDDIMGANPSIDMETQPDMYSFHVLGLSGTMFVDYATGVAYCIEHPDIKAIPTLVNTGSIPIKVITEWVITDASGNIFYFSLPEETYVYDNNSSDAFKKYNSSWLLTKIETKNNRDLILFNYGAKTEWEQPQLAGRTDLRVDYHNSTEGNDLDLVPASPVYKISQAELISITINGKTAAQFITDSQSTRADLVGRKALTEIQTINSEGNVTNRYKFIQSYFGNTSANDEKKVRLKLDRLEIHGQAITTEPLAYRFQYNAGTLPSRESFAQDFWGYYNNNNKSTLIPYNNEYDPDNTSFIGADRFPDLTRCKVGTLSSITYPTGGSTELEYSLHDANEEAVQYEENYYVSGGELKGSLDGTTSTTFNYSQCHEIVEPNIPKGKRTLFRLTKPGTFKIRTYSIRDNVSPQANPLRALFLYKADIATGGTFCDINETYAGNPDVIIRKVSFSSATYDNTTTYNLAAGAYYIMMVNSDPALTFGIEITGTRTISSDKVGGLRTIKSIDKNQDGSVLRKKYYYYGDLSIVQNSLIDEAFLQANATTSSGLLHQDLLFEETKITEYYDADGELVVKGALNRYSSNRVQADHLIGYSTVTEVEFSNSTNAFNGFTVYDFFNTPENYTGGFKKHALLNGRVSKKRVYDKASTLLLSEESFYTKRPVASVSGFYFYVEKQFSDDLYIKEDKANLGQEFFIYQKPGFVLTNGNWQAQHCIDDGKGCSLFTATDYHDGNNGLYSYHSGSTCYSPDWTAINYNNNHPATQYFNTLVNSGSQGVKREHYSSTNIVAVCRPIYNIIQCYNPGSLIKKGQYTVTRYWITQDSTKAIQYSPQGNFKTFSENLYENTNHYQVTKVRQIDSKGIWNTTKFSYPEEMKTAYPSNPIWQNLINKNRISEVIHKQSFKTNPDNSLTILSTENTTYKNVGTMILPDIMQFSMGSTALEDRLEFSQYDNVGNLTEVKKMYDYKTSVIYGYNKSIATAQVQNGAINEIFYTSFEAGEEGGNSSVDDSRTGRYSKVGGYSKALSGLTAGTTYTLTYWLKTVSEWSLQTQSIVLNTSTTTYTINLSGQVDEVRFHPTRARMTTFTYDPGIGLTSSTDVNNRSSYYTYDSLGRLVLVKDDTQNTLKAYTYHHYQSQ